MRRRRARRTSALSIVVGGALAVISAVVAPVAASAAASASLVAPGAIAAPFALPGAPGAGCSYANAGTGAYSETLCWLDFSQSDGSAISTEYASAGVTSGPACSLQQRQWSCTSTVSFDSVLGTAYGRTSGSGTGTAASQADARAASIANATAAARSTLTAVASGSETKYYGSISNYPMTVTLAGGYVLTADLSTSAANAAGYVMGASPFPTWSGAFLGNNNFYSGVTGNPALYQRSGGRSTFTLTNISLRANGSMASNFSVVVADAESTDSGESISWSAGGAGNFAWLPNTPGATTKQGTMGSACSSWTPAIGTSGSSASCSSDSTVSGSLKTGTPMLMVSPVSTATPFSISTTLVGSGLQGGAIGVVITRAQATVKVTDRIAGGNGGALDGTVFSVGMNGTVASASGTATEATTGGIPSLAAQDGTPIEYSTSLSGGTYAASYTPSWQCYKTDPSSTTQIWWPSQTTASSTPPSSSAGGFARLSAGQFLSCTVTYTPPYLTLSKSVANGSSGATASPSQFTLSAAGNGLSSVSVPGDNTAKKAVAVGSYSLTESSALAGYDWTNLACTGSNGSPTVSTTPATAPYTSASVPVAKGNAVTCTYTNTARTSVVTWDKIDADTGRFIGGSGWSLVGPSGGSSSTIAVADNTGQAGYGGRDANPTAGRFTVSGLPWGTYTLTETQAPAGYTITGSPVTITVGGATTTVNAGTFTNARILSFGVEKRTYTASGLGTLLDGGSFSVLTNVNDQPGTVVGGATVSPATSAGAYTMTGLRPGTYWLAETKAPAGHQLLPQPVKFTVVYDTSNTTPRLQLVGTNQTLASLSSDGQTLRVADVPTLVLPLSGGNGWALPAAIGAGLLILVVGWAWWRRKSATLRMADIDTVSPLIASPHNPGEDPHEGH